MTAPASSAGEPRTISELARRIRHGELSPVELTEEFLRNIERLQPSLNAFITVTADLALDQARQAEKEIRDGFYRGPLHGIPYAAKDLFNTKGVRTTMGSKIMAGFTPAENSTVIQKLNAAGAVLVGKAGLHEWAYGITSNNAHFGAVRNPWDPERIPGGSSGGSTAALAAGMCMFSLGTDTGGSIRIPAALCGVTGLKPTFGRISRYGLYPLGHTLDTVGPFALTAEDAALVYRALAGGDPHDDSSVDRTLRLPVFGSSPRLEGKRIGVPRNFYFDELAPEVDSAMKEALGVFRGLGASLAEVEVPDMEEFNAVARLILLAEATSVHHRRLRERREDFSPELRALLDQGLFVTAVDYLDAQRRRRALMEAFDALLENVDVLVVPATPVTAPKIGQSDVEIGGLKQDTRLAMTRLVRGLNPTGLPVLTLPCGAGAGELPIGMQIIGPRFQEELVLEAGHAYQQASAWHKRRPPGAN